MRERSPFDDGARSAGRAYGGGASLRGAGRVAAATVDRIIASPAYYGAAFVMALTIGSICANALFLQNTRHPAPLFGDWRETVTETPAATVTAPQAMPGSVTIGARREGESVAFYVTDTGIGIAEADIPKLGTPFVQADSSYDRKYEGTGLGLSVVRGLVALHDGDLRIASKLGRGTTITVRLPISGPAPRLPAEEESQEAEDTAPVELAAARKERQLNRA